MHVKLTCLCTLLLHAGMLASQNYITNSGFEGPDGIEVIPQDWYAGCGVMNTPDTQPGWWNVENEPYEGNSFINLLFKEDGTTESVYQPLENPLDSGACFLIEIHLAQACQDSLSGLDPYDLNHPGDLLIRGSSSYGCNNGQILAEFKQVSNCKWKKFYAVFQAHETIEFIYLEFSKGTSTFNNGSVLIDLFNLENLHPLPDHITEVNYQNELVLAAAMIGNGYIWTIGDSVINLDSNQISLVIEHDLIIDLEYFSTDGCLIQERFVIYAKPHIPNVFTPLDQDGINDVFFIDGLVEEASLSVFNRWGEVVYSDTHYQNNWSPEELNSGVYFYQLELLHSGRIYQGFVTIF